MIRESLWTLTSRVVLLVINIVLTVMTAQLLGPAGRGAYALLGTYLTVMVLVGGLGIGQANVFFGARQPELRPRLAWNSVVAGVVLGLLMVPLGVVGAGILRPAFAHVTAPQLLIVLAACVPFLVAQLLGQLLLGGQRLAAYNALMVLQGVSALALMSALVLRPSIEVALAAILGANIVWCIGTVIVVVRAGELPPPPRVDLALLHRSLTFGVGLYLSTAAQYLNTRLSLFLVSGLAAPEALGQYSIAVYVAEVLLQVTTAFQIVLLPKVSAESRVSDADAGRQVSRISSLGFVMTTALALVVGCLARPLLSALFGGQFLPALPAVYTLLPGVALYSVANVLLSFVIGRGHPMMTLLVAVAGTLVGAGLSFVWIPRFGIAGAGAATAAGYAASTGVMIVVFCRISGERPWRTFVPAFTDLRDLTVALRRLRTRPPSTPDGLV